MNEYAYIGAGAGFLVLVLLKCVRKYCYKTKVEQPKKRIDYI
jgi:hypothetical protein